LRSSSEPRPFVSICLGSRNGPSCWCGLTD
jgi:hypothetical protein